MCNIAVYAADTNLYSKCDQASDLCQQVELASELQPDVRYIEDWVRQWLIDFNDGKTQLDSFEWSNNTGAIDVKMDSSVLKEKSSFEMLGLPFSSTFDCGSYIISIIKTAFKKSGALIRFIKFLS